MNREPRITDVGADVEPRPRPPWLLPAVIGVGGFALGLLVATTIGSTGPSEAAPTLPPRQATTPTTAPAAPLSTTTTAPEVESESLPTLEELVPGFEGTLYFTNPASSDSNDRFVVAWSSDSSEPIVTGIPSPFPHLDVTGSMMAAPAGRTLDTLFPGTVLAIYSNLDKSREVPIEPDGYVGSAVSGFAWHESEPGLLAWIEFDNSTRSVIKTADLGLSSEQLIRSTEVAELEGIAWPALWDDDVFVVQTLSRSLDLIDGQAVTGQAEVRTLDADGELLGVTLGEFVGRLPTGELVISDSSGEGDEVSYRTYLTDVALGERLVPEWLPEGSLVRSVLPTPGGSRVFLVGENHDGTTFLGRVELDGVNLLQCLQDPSFLGSHQSPDGDWIVLQSGGPGEQSLWFVNGVTCASTRVPLPENAGSLAAVGR